MRPLVLNAGYEPLRSPGSLRREGLSLATPSVILLVRYVRAPRRRAVAVSRRGVLRRDAHRCAYCRGQAATVDHVVPRSRGGADSWENLVACCLRCNGVKGDRTPEEMGWRLHQRPYAPSGPLWALRGAESLDPSWEEFLGVAA